MVNLTDFLPYVLPHATGCSYPLAEMYIRQACIDFCTVAPVAQVQLDPMSAKAGQFEYELEPPFGMAVTFILRAKFQDRHLGIFKSGDSDDLLNQIGDPSAYRQSGDPIFKLNLAPRADIQNAISLLVATKPTNNAQAVADILYNDYAYAIGLGALSRLLKISGHSFTNPASAADFKRDYEIERTNARIRAETSFGLGGTTATYRRFI